MNFWKSNCQGGESNVSLLAGLQDGIDTIVSPNVSDTNSIEYSSDNSLSNEQPAKAYKLFEKTTLPAKNKLQSYKRLSNLKCNEVKEDGISENIIEDSPSDSPETNTTQSADRKAVANAIILNIGLLKRTEFKYEPPSKALPAGIHIPNDTVHQIKHTEKSNEANMFKKREIKCRNIRKGKILSSKKRSYSPKRFINKKYDKKKEKTRGGKEYPTNWEEYKKLKLNPSKHSALKSKLFIKSKGSKFELKNYFSFQTPSARLQSYKAESRNGASTIWIPLKYIRCTTTTPQVLYSPNQQSTSSTHLNRAQLFSIIPRERKVIIEKLFKFSRTESDPNITVRKWYPKNWKKADLFEAKLLENSVGLSFLQSYSDDEEEHLVAEQKIEEINLPAEEPQKDDLLQRENEEILTPAGTPKLSCDAREDKEDGEITEEEKYVKKVEDDFDIVVDDYEKTKEELKQLEATLKSTEFLEAVREAERPKIETVQKKDIKKKKKKIHVDKVSKNKNLKKKLKKKTRKNKSQSKSDSDGRRKKQKKKVDAAKKSSKKRKDKKKKDKSKRASPSARDSHDEFDIELERALAKKKKKKRASRKRTTSRELDRPEENYEDDIKFFADRLDAECKLKGKSKHKTHINIVLEDISLDEKFAKEKTSESVVEESGSKSEEMKVDLLKMNEAYLKEQKRKEEEEEEKDKKALEEDKEPKKPVVKEVVKHKRKRHRSHAKDDNKIKLDEMDLEPPEEEVIGMKDVKKEKLVAELESEFDEVLKEIANNEDEIRLEMPLKLCSFERKEVKMEQIAIDEVKPSESLEDRLELELLSKVDCLESIIVEKEIKTIPEDDLASIIVEEEVRETAILPPKAPEPILPIAHPEQLETINIMNEIVFNPPSNQVQLSVKRPNDSADESIVKKSRWDIKADNNCPANNDDLDSTTLENEYEQFLKAVAPASDTSPISSDTTSANSSVVFMKPDDTTTIQIPLTSIETEQIQPVPSPNVDLNQSLINLSVSATVTQNITVSLTSAPPITSNVELADKKMIFTSLELPPKKVLMGNKVNLVDSDDDEVQIIIEDNKHEELKGPVVPTRGPSITKEEIRLQTDVRKFMEPSPKRYASRRSPIRRSRGRRSPIINRRRSPKLRSPIRRRKSPIVVRRSLSPRRRISPRRRSPIKRKRSQSPRRRTSPSPRRRSSNNSCRRTIANLRSTSPLKRSVADSTISDDQLAQSAQLNKSYQESPKRMSLDERINQVLGYQEQTTSTENYRQQSYHVTEQYSSIQSHITKPSLRIPQNTYREVGNNMLHIVPTEDLMPMIPMNEEKQWNRTENVRECHTASREKASLRFSPPPSINLKPKILQVGNMLQIVPISCDTLLATGKNQIPPSPLQTAEVIKTEKIDNDDSHYGMPGSCYTTTPEKPSAETGLLQKLAENRAEREKRRQEREKRRIEKERRRKEKEIERQDRLKIKTENMIKKALELEQEEEEPIESDFNSDHHTQWPPLPLLVTHTVNDAAKSILINKHRHLNDSLYIERPTKKVHFADGIRPGEGTSPSAGEDLSSPPPPKIKLPKEKRFKKLKFGKRSSKKKVKIIRKIASPLEDSGSEDNLPPPSPPPGSPPPHVFPPRIKVKPVNNVSANYLATIIHTAQQQPPPQQQYQFPPPINLMMVPPRQNRLSSVRSPHVSLPSTALSPPTVSHFHPGMAAHPPPPPPIPHSSGRSRHY